MNSRQVKTYIKKEITNFVRLAWTIKEDESWTFDAMSKTGDTSSQTISRLMNGKTKSPHFATLLKIGNVLNLRIDWNQVEEKAVKRSIKFSKQKVA